MRSSHIASRAASLVVMVALVWTALWASSARDAPVYPPESKWDRHLLDLEQQAIETAFNTQIALLYANWMKDYAANEPQRVANGARNARNAYVRAMTKIEERRGQLP